MSIAKLVAASRPGLSVAAQLDDNLEEARAWVHEVLGPLSCDTDNDSRLRETLRVFLRNGGSYQCTADQLNLQVDSVKYRVQRAVGRRGRPINDHLDVELALLVSYWFGGALLQPIAS
jgi:DNA-binding PucR family transcriptional regulator